MQTTAAEVASYKERIKVAAEAAAAESARQAAKALVEVEKVRSYDCTFNQRFFVDHMKFLSKQLESAFPLRCLC